jgi:hypothetical protein
MDEHVTPIEIKQYHIMNRKHGHTCKRKTFGSEGNDGQKIRINQDLMRPLWTARYGRNLEAALNWPYTVVDG